MEKKSENVTPDLIHYKALRTLLGVLGLSLPLVLYVGAAIIFRKDLQSSISSYYYTGMRDVFVGMLWAIGLFLFTYKGYKPKNPPWDNDNLFGNIAGVGAVGTALFPTAPGRFASETAQIVGKVHYVFAGFLFITLAYFALVLFTNTHKDSKTGKNLSRKPKKVLRDWIFRVCGVTMFVCIALVIIHALLPGEARSALEGYHPIFWLESVMVISFGFSWLVKAQVIPLFKDPDSPQ